MTPWKYLKDHLPIQKLDKIGKNNKKPTVFPSLVFSTSGYHWTDKSGGGHGAFMASSTSSGGETQSR
jgi:hypothetical protein